MLRESLERRAREAGRWAGHNRHCAEMLAKRYRRAGRPGTAERLGRYRVEAGELTAALEPLLSAAREKVERRHRFREIHALLDQREDILDRLGASQEDRARVAGWVVRATAYSLEARQLGRAARWAEQAAEVARRHGWTDCLADAIFRLGYIVHHRGQIGRAATYLDEARRLYTALDDAEGVTSSLIGLAHTSERTGDLAGAEAYLEEALGLSERARDASGLAKALRALAVVVRFRGEFERSIDLSQRAMALLTEQGNRLGEAACLNDLAECERERGNLDEADRLYAMAVARYESIGTGQVLIARFNRTIVWVARGELERATTELERLRTQTREGGFDGLLAGIFALLTTCAAAQGKWAQWDPNLREVARLLEKTDLIDKDFAWALEQAGDLARDAGFEDRARAAWELALAQWRGVSDAARCGVLEAKLAGV
jgi:tetratricopeptide (TPR) repeat protein